ncbi:amidohydrolase [Calderihabitans maritimus]|uniref:Amidohydrolase n=1 Tax=Calderihabitans maritimus TaxID=1246530 RepID=A0A1Z5HQJ3_9FIRM|nr:amidohydrolase [Calderihabitans maritimus]GAW91784.1 amidohydrolase [Calderihabitans maritimus]
MNALSFLQQVDENQERILRTYEELHCMPEPAWKEFRTTQYVAERMRKMGLKVIAAKPTGVVGFWRGKSGGPAVGLRADLDALLYHDGQEETAVHACGHDAHTAMVLSTAEILSCSGFYPPGEIRFLFQPAEEKAAGALCFIEQGFLDNVDYLVGIHLRPAEEARYGQASPAVLHGSSLVLEGTIYGQASHSARPHLGINVINAAAAVINAINAVSVDPRVPASAKVTRLQAGGEAHNIIPDRALFTIDLRAQNNETMTELRDKVERAVKAATGTVGAQVDMKELAYVPAARVDEEMLEKARWAIREVMGEDGLLPPIITPGGEDFHFYSYHLPRLKSIMIGLGCDLVPGLHHPQMTFRKDALLQGVKILGLIILKLLNGS